ncbi:MAG: hypothetical protein ACRDTJ_26920, partial [Pseudonocardiaceae bacterium]
VEGGIAGARLPRKFPPYQTVYGAFAAGPAMAPGSASTTRCAICSACTRVAIRLRVQRSLTPSR